MSEYIEVSAKTLEDAKYEAQRRLGIQSDMLEYEVVDKGSRGLFGIGARDVVIKARRKFIEKDKKQKPAENRPKPAREKEQPAKAERPERPERPVKSFEKKEEPAKPVKAFEKKEAPEKPAVAPDKKEAPSKPAPVSEKKEVREKAPAAVKEAAEKAVPVKKEAQAVKEPAKKEDRKKFDDKKTGGFKETVVSVKTVDQREEKERVLLNDEQKASVIEKAGEFVGGMLTKMGIENKLDISFDDAEQSISIDVSGPDMGSLIGKRGQTLYAVQYLASLYVNKFTDDYIRIKVDTENYKERRTESLEKWANTMANKVRKTHRSITVEPMNPYERRIIHVTLQNNPYVETYSEGVDPYRKIVIAPKR
ncbi:MAG: Jag N-terminal domain-containing protein [Lachnospiraceae bacterium]|nr:Jag N-terminal domain-containing protein [Lachnospiraceae bacterium]